MSSLKTEVLVELHRQLAALKNPHVHSWAFLDPTEADFEYATARTLEAIAAVKTLPDNLEDLGLFDFLAHFN